MCLLNAVPAKWGKLCQRGCSSLLYFLSLPLSGTRWQMNCAQLVNSTLGVSLSHKELWANLVRLGPGTLSRAARDAGTQRKKAQIPAWGRKTGEGTKECDRTSGEDSKE